MKPSLPTLHFQFAAAFAVLLLASQTLRAEINPDPGSGEVTSLSVTRTVPGSTVYDPAVPLAGEETYAMTPDRYGQINLTLEITHNFQGTITTSIRDADGFTITQATGNSPTLSFSPRKFRYPFVITVTSPTNVPAFTRLIVPDGDGNTLGSGFVGHHGDHGTDWDRDELTLLPQYDDSGGYDLEGRSVSSGSCGPCQSSSCDLSHGNETANADTSGPQGRFLAGFSAGTSMQGDSFSGVDVEINPTAGVSRASFKAYGTGDAVITRVNQTLATITTQSAHTEFENISNGVRVSISRTANDDPFRVITFVNTAPNEVTRTSTFLEKSVITVWKYSASPRTWTITMGNGARVSKLILTEDGTSQRVQTRQLYERSANETGIANILVSEVHETYQKNLLGWRKTRSEIPCVTNGNLITKWQYYAVADGNTRSGLLKSVQRPDGSYENHDYFIDSNSKTHHTISRPFAGEGTLTESRFRVSNGSRIDFKESVSDGVLSGILSESYQNWSSSIQMSHHQYDGSGYLVTTYSIKAFGTDFGGVPTRIEHPDGTLTTQSISRQPNNGYRNLTIERGSRDGTVVGEGVTITTARDQNGVLHTKTVTAKGGAGNGITLESIAAAYPDIIGRPTQINYFIGSPNSWTIHREYACCGLVSETDKFGVITYYHHDDLGRRVRVNRLGVSHATVYDGLTVRTHRYPGTVSDETWTGNPSLSNEISNTTRNLAGTFRHSWERSPQTEAASPDADPPSYSDSPTLFSTTESRYRNPAAASPNPHGLPSGIGLRVFRQYVQTTDDPQRPTETADYHLDGRIFKSTGHMSPHIRHTYSVNGDGLASTKFYLNGNSSHEETITQYDRAGRIKTVTKGSSVHHYNYFNSADPLGSRGQLKSITDSDQVTTLYAYNAKGERTITATDVNGDSEINEDGIDRVTISETVPSTHQNHDVFSTVTKVFATLNNPVPTLFHTRHVAVNGLREWSVPNDGSPPSYTETILQSGDNWTITTTHSDGTKTKNIHTGGRLTRVEQLSADNTPVLIAFTDYEYDSLNRLQTATDSRTGPTTTAYLSTTCDFVKSVEDAGQRVTAFTYDHRGRRKTVDSPNTDDRTVNPPGVFQNITTTNYFPDGSVKSVSGGQSYPVSYTYDYAGRMKTMTTYRAADQGEPVITAWNYSSTTGLLQSKRYNSNLAGTAGTGPTYQYTNGQRLWKRLWARTLDPQDHQSANVTTTYSYTAGLLTGVSYNDATLALEFFHDRLGRLTSVKRGGYNHAEYTYSPTSFRLTLEKLNRDTHERYLHRHYDDPTGRPLSLNLTTPGGTTQYTTGYGYDTAGRLDRVWHHPALDATTKAPTDDPSFTYGYTYTQAQAGALRVGATTGQNLKQDLMPYTVTKNAWSGSPAFTANRTYEGTRDALNSIENRVDGFLVSGYTYLVNAIGQRESVSTSGSAFTGTPADWSWHHNARGEVVSAASPVAARDRAYQYDFIGNRKKSAHGTLDLPANDNYQSNALNQYQAVPDFAPQPGFDLDGNMRSGPVPGTAGNTPGVQAPANATDLQWDAENRLISATVANIGTVTYQYDYLSRLIRRQFNQDTPNHYHYDGWNRVAEFLSDEAPTRTYTWGLDLSGTMQGAGGVGGLLATRHGSTSYFPFYDGNGNVTEYMNAAGGQSAHFEYDPYGTLTRRSGLIIFTYRFSTKPRDVTTGLYYYGYRWYDPVTGRWPSRDPIEEDGGINLYWFVKNQALVNIDYIGLRDINVDYCSIHIHYGHLSKAKGKTINWLFNGKCNFGGAIGCFPDVNNPPDIVQRQNNRGIYPESHQIPGIPTHGNGVHLMNERRDEAISRVATMNGTSNENQITARHRNHSEEHGMPFILDNAANSNNIQILVDELCRKDGCCCKEVRFTLHIDGSGGLDSKIQSGIDRFSNVWKNKIKVGEKFRKTFKCGEKVLLP